MRNVRFLRCLLSFHTFFFVLLLLRARRLKADTQALLETLSCAWVTADEATVAVLKIWIAIRMRCTVARFFGWNFVNVHCLKSNLLSGSPYEITATLRNVVITGKTWRYTYLVPTGTMGEIVSRTTHRFINVRWNKTFTHTFNVLCRKRDVYKRQSYEIHAY